MHPAVPVGIAAAQTGQLLGDHDWQRSDPRPADESAALTEEVIVIQTMASSNGVCMVVFCV